MEWKIINGFPDYTISEEGQVKNQKGQIMKTRLDSSGYERINLQRNKQKHTVRIHWAVISTFNPIENTKHMTVDHKDGNVKNNHISNLRWVSLGENLSLQHFKNNEKIIFFVNELRREYSEDELSAILEKLLSLANLLKNGGR